MTKPESFTTPAKRERKLQTITLKVFIHCEGCRRKIRHIIRVLDGVENVVVDSATGKVTITGTEIDIKIVLQRLQKYGKQAEVWPTGSAVAPATAKSAGANQGKPSNGNSPNTNAKKSENAGCDGKIEGTKPAGPSRNGGNKGGGKKDNKESSVADQIVDGNEGGGRNESMEAEKSKETDVDEAAEASESRSPQGNEGNGGGAGKKGKKGGSGPDNGCGVDGVPQRPRPPPIHHVQDVPITSLPVTSTVMVSASRAPAPHNYIQTGYSEYQSVDYATHMFSDENANNCSIM